MNRRKTLPGPFLVLEQRTKWTGERPGNLDKWTWKCTTESIKQHHAMPGGPSPSQRPRGHRPRPSKFVLREKGGVLVVLEVWHAHLYTFAHLDALLIGSWVRSWVPFPNTSNFALQLLLVCKEGVEFNNHLGVDRGGTASSLPHLEAHSLRRRLIFFTTKTRYQTAQMAVE